MVGVGLSSVFVGFRVQKYKKNLKPKQEEW